MSGTEDAWDMNLVLDGGLQQIAAKKQLEGEDLSGFVAAAFQNREKVMERLRKDPLILTDMPTEIQDDAEFVTVAVRENYGALAGASNRLRGDIDMVATFFKSLLEIYSVYGEDYDKKIAKEYFSLERDLAVELLEKPFEALKRFKVLFKLDNFYIYVKDEVRADRDFALESIVEHPRCSRYVPAELLNDKKFLLEALNGNPSYGIIERVPKEVRDLVDNGGIEALEDAIKMEEKESLLSAMKKTTARRGLTPKV